MRQPVSLRTSLLVGTAGASAVLFGAFGAHALREVLDARGSALALGAPRWCGIITPFGGVAFIVGWIALALSLRSGQQSG